MVDYERTRRQQILREAEGYLDLILVVSAQAPLAPALRNRMAERCLETLHRLDRPTRSRGRARYLTGLAYRLMERYADAILPLEQAAEIEPENLQIWIELGWCHKRNGRLDLAIQSLEEALAIDSGEAIIHYNLACYWSLAGNSKLALAYLGRSFELNADYRELASDEPDFDPIRNHPGFRSLTSVTV